MSVNKKKKKEKEFDLNRIIMFCYITIMVIIPIIYFSYQMFILMGATVSNYYTDESNELLKKFIMNDYKIIINGTIRTYIIFIFIQAFNYMIFKTMKDNVLIILTIIEAIIFIIGLYPYNIVMNFDLVLLSITIIFTNLLLYMIDKKEVK